MMMGRDLYSSNSLICFEMFIPRVLYYVSRGNMMKNSMHFTIYLNTSTCLPLSQFVVITEPRLDFYYAMINYNDLKLHFSVEVEE